MIEENFEGVNLTIYYMSPCITTRAPLSVDDLIYGTTAMNEKKKRDEINGQYEYKIIVNGHKMEEYIDTLEQLRNTALLPIDNKTKISTRIYYVFEIKKEHKIFDVAMWGSTANSMFVNGIAVEGNNIFYDVIMPFLPEEAARELEKYR
jgi:hypothetical protein